MVPRLLLAIAICLLGFPARTAFGTDAAWLAPLDGDWSDATNWSTDPLAPVGANDTALLDATGAAFAATVSQNTLLDAVTINSPDAT